METEKSRRSSVDRSRESALKKPRLAEAAAVRARAPNGSGSAAAQPDRGRPSSGGGRGQPSIPRPRAAAAAAKEKEETEDPLRGQQQQKLQQEELLTQYKTAISELTFNSKPIITNLTIIAGENQHAAKEIAAIICVNILEVPSDQKLPSLYLLDSIVKNIANDYVKYFAARLPEVFCKAYKQVDSSIHPGMRHLFGTWKGVFPAAPLQIIEKELCFPPNVNSSSGTTTSKPESQTTQVSSHSIHVNPKYLEARQRLQQSSRAKDTSSDDPSGTASVNDTERSDRAATGGSTRQGNKAPVKNIQRPQTEQLSDSIREKKGYREVMDHKISSEVPQKSDLGARMVNEKVKERDVLDKPFYRAGSIASEASESRRNDFDFGHAYSNYQKSGSSIMARQLSPNHVNTNTSSKPISKNWKNSMEEEYTWDDINSRLSDYGGTSSSIKGSWNNDAEKHANLQRGKWTPEPLDSHWNKFDAFTRLGQNSGGEERGPLFRDIEHLPQPRSQQDMDPRLNMESRADPYFVGRAASGYHSSSVWPPREPPPLLDGLGQISVRIPSQSEGQAFPQSRGFSTSSSIHRPGFSPHSLTSSGGPFIGTYGQQRQPPPQPPSPTAQSPPAYVPSHHPKPHSSIDHDRHIHPFSQLPPKPMQLPGQFNRMPYTPVAHDSFTILAQSQQSHTSLKSQPPQHLPNSPAALAQLKHHLPFLHPSQSDPTQQEKQSLNQTSIQDEKPSYLSHDISGGQSNNSVDVSGKPSTSNLLAAIMKSGIIPSISPSNFPSLNMQPPLPTGPPPFQPSATPSTQLPSVTHINTPALVSPLASAPLPPLPPGPPPASYLAVTATSQSSNMSNVISNPILGMLSSLLEKGIISKPATGAPAAISVPIPDKPSDQSSNIASVLAPSNTATPNIPPSSVKEPEKSESSEPPGAPLSQSTATELGNLIGYDFKPETIREFHPSVIRSLFDDSNHPCKVCGLRFGLQEQLSDHLDQHTSINSDRSSFRMWFVDKSSWITGSKGASSGPMAIEFLEDVAPVEDMSEPMVPADESQSICALCGEPFEDFYCDEKDEWMYKGTVYLNLIGQEADIGSTDVSMGEGPIVHAKCVSSSVHHDEIELDEGNKVGC